jgi:hypothetical protein
MEKVTVGAIDGYIIKFPALSLGEDEMGKVKTESD